jgi:hypothetical protein
MPLNETPLPQSTIDAIEQWITNGALPATSSSVNAMQKLQALGHDTAAPQFSVSFAWPVDGTVIEAPVSHIVIAFNQEVDATLVNYTTFIVTRADATPGSDSTTQAPAIPSYAALAEGNSSTVVITPVAPLLPGIYRVTVRGTGGGALANLGAQALGTDYSFTFTVDGSP